MTVGAEGEAAIPEAVTPEEVDPGRLQGQHLPAAGEVPQLHLGRCIGNEASEASRRPSGLNASFQIM